ncbi:hypothetical protein VP01_1166g3 [Puccinia sorghi]|uniref:Uncharacterized protein n=1 Tax=Puccinia sorghi TaxID=27349 RepID=A0A0L6VSU6_9BASI|nr:hypothetical protein VP01_1166g3 [Puccinia sorghi]
MLIHLNPYLWANLCVYCKFVWDHIKIEIPVMCNLEMKIGAPMPPKWGDNWLPQDDEQLSESWLKISKYSIQSTRPKKTSFGDLWKNTTMTRLGQVLLVPSQGITICCLG